MGEAGLGKSRLAAEARKSVDGAARGGALEWHEGRSLSYETTTPYAPVNDLLNSFFKLSAQDDDAAKHGSQNGYGKIHAAVERLLPGRGDALSPFLASPIGIGLEGDALQRVMYLEPPALRERVANAISTYVEALAVQTPTLLLFEDLHWADSSSLEILEGLLPVTERAPLLLMALFRPHASEPSWRFHQAALRDYADGYTQITLQPLSSTSARELVANLLEIEDLPEKVRELILSKAEGNPFYVEEVIRSLLDEGLVVRENSRWRATREIAHIAVPDTLAGVITARLDRLDDTAKLVAQTAAVIGRDFRLDVLREIYGSQNGHDYTGLESALSTLQKRELIRERSKGSLPGQGSLPDPRPPTPVRTTLTFKHVLTQETAYTSLLMSKRRELHLRVAEYLEKLMPPGGVRAPFREEPDHVHDIARHFMEAREPARALPYLVEAGWRAAGTFARDEALAYFRQAIGVAQTSMPPRIEEALSEVRRAYEGLGKTLEYSMDIPGAIAAYQEMFSYADRRGDVPMKVSALNKLSYVKAFMMGRFPDAEGSLRDAEELAAGADDTAGLAETYTVRCGICTATADFSNAERYLTEAAEAGRKLDQKRLTAYGLAHKSQTLTFLAQFSAAWETAQEGLRVAEEANDFERRSEILTMAVPYYHIVHGDLDSARQALKEGYDLGVKIGLMIPPVIGAMLLAMVAQMRGEYEEALEWHEKSIEAARRVAQIFPFMLAMPLGGIGAVCIEVSEGLADRAQEYHRELLEVLQTPSGGPAAGISWTDLGFCALALGEIDYAHTYFRSALSSPSMHMYLQKPRMLAGSALVALHQGRLDDAAKLAEEGCRDAQEREMKQMYPLVYLTRGDVCMARGEIEEALRHFMRAEVDAAQMMMRPSLWQAQAGYARALEAQGHLDEAAAKRRQAVQTIGTITSLFRDQTLCSMFTAGAMKKLERAEV
jgi:tetratricopeptide (TPR) repeat protein